MLVLQHDSPDPAGLKLPVFQGIEISEHEAGDGQRPTLLITLKRGDDREIFLLLCTDIVDPARAWSTVPGPLR